jgi:hypothetical protein
LFFEFMVLLFCGGGKSERFSAPCGAAPARRRPTTSTTTRSGQQGCDRGRWNNHHRPRCSWRHWSVRVWWEERVPQGEQQQPLASPRAAPLEPALRQHCCSPQARPPRCPRRCWTNPQRARNFVRASNQTVRRDKRWWPPTPTCKHPMPHERSARAARRCRCFASSRSAPPLQWLGLSRQSSRPTATAPNSARPRRCRCPTGSRRQGWCRCWQFATWRCAHPPLQLETPRPACNRHLPPSWC